MFHEGASNMKKKMTGSIIARAKMAAAGSGMAILLHAQAAAEPAERPNFVLFYVDDMGWAGVGCYGSDFIDTPQIDRLAAEGVLFTDAYSPGPNCAPSRASMLTGLYVTRHGITHVASADHPRWRDEVLVPADPALALSHDFVTWAKILQENGYQTACIGKWHLGPERYYPEHHGFDVNIGGISRGQHNAVFPPYFRGDRFADALPGKPGEHITDAQLRHALDFIENVADDAPFFLYLSFYAVHRPFGGTAELEEKYAARFPGDDERIAYAAMTEGIDQAVGALRAKLRERGMDQNTILVFTSDNGGVYEPTNKGLRGRKGHLYEGGIRVPLIISGPGIQQGGVEKDPVWQVDFFPTFLDFAGHPVPENDGISLTPVLTGRGAIPDRNLYWHFPHYSFAGGRPSSVMRRGDYKLLHWYETNTQDLYQLREDQLEQNNLVDVQPERAAMMRDQLIDWLAETGAVMPSPR